MQTYGIKSLSQHFEEEVYQYINITWLLLTGKQLCWSIKKFIRTFLRAPILKEHLRTAASENVLMRKINIYS